MARSKISNSPSSSSASATGKKEKARQIIAQLNSKSVNPSLFVRYASFPGQNSLGELSPQMTPFALDALISFLKDKWSTTLNTFVFNEGFLSPTLMDVSTMLSLPIEVAGWEALKLSFNLPETLKLIVWEVCPHCLAYEIIDLASALAKANQVIASQRQEITALSIKAHQDVVSIITKEIPVHLSSPEKKQKLAAEKERAVKIKQEQSLQVEAAMEAKKKAIQDEEEKMRLELERKQKEELDAKRRTKFEADPLTVPTVPTVEETKEKTTIPIISTLELEIIEQTLEDVDPSTALVLTTLTPDAKPLSQQPLLDTQIIKVDIEDLSELEVDQLIKKASSVLEEMKSASKASTSSSSKTPASPVSQVMNAVVVMRNILE
uniref:Aminotransferase-like plant mobile domain-containing protein n=1 Tax=Fagus sylvatica TaxID=28930 RepID=A0A2N9I815_FAGSY